MLSGTALSNWAFASDPVTKAEFLINQLNCTQPTPSPISTLDCLQQIADFRAFRDVDMSSFENDFSPIWGPVIDSRLVDAQPMKNMMRGEYLNYEVRAKVSSHSLKLPILTQTWKLSFLKAEKQG